MNIVGADVARLPFANHSYDGATGHSVLDLIDDSDAALREVHRVVRRGGGVAFLKPNGAIGAARLRTMFRSYRDGFR